MTPQELRYSFFKLAFSGKIVEQKSGEKIIDKKAFDLDDAPFDIPNSWKWNLIGNVCEMYTGDSIAENVKKVKYEGLKEGFDYIGTKDVSFEHTISYNNGVRIPFENEFKRAYNGCILMCIEGGSAGRKIAILDREVCFGNKLCMFNASSVFNKFLYFYLQTSEFKSIFSDNLSGIIGGVSIKKIKSILIPIPPFDEQKRIVSKIEELLPFVDRYEEAWNKLEKLNGKFPVDMINSVMTLAIKGGLTHHSKSESLDNLKESLMSFHTKKKSHINIPFDEEEIPFGLPDNWEWMRLEELCKLITDGTHKTPHYVDSGVPFISVKDISSGFISFDNTKFITASEHAELTKRCKPEKDDVLICRIGTLGKALPIKTNREFSIFVSLGLVKLILPEMSDYISYVINSGYGFSWIQRVKVGGGTHTFKINLDDLRLMPIPVPPLEEQNRIVTRIEELLPLCRKLVK